MKRGLLLMVLCALLAGCGVERTLDKAQRALERHELVEAEAHFRRVLDREPDHPDALYGLGWTYHLGGEEERAREYFRRCTLVAPEDHRGFKGLGSVALGGDDPRLAEEYFQKALLLAPDDPAVLNSLALTWLSMDRLEDAEGLMARLVAAWPDRGEYGYNLAEVQLQLGRPAEALESIERALDARIDEVRFKALLLELRARALVAMTANRVDVEDCEGTAPPVLAWLGRADRSLDRAETMGVELPSLHAARRRVYARRSVVTEQCPGLEAGP